MAARMAVMTSRLVGSLVFAPAIRSSAHWGSSIDWLITCAHPSVMIWLGWLVGRGRGGLCMYSCREGKMLEPCGPDGGRGGCCCSRVVALAAYSAGVGRPLERAAVVAMAETVVDEGREGRLFLPTRDAVLVMGVGVGLLAWLRSRGFVRVREVVWTCIGGGGERAFGVVWGSVSISESGSPSSPQNARGTFESASHCPIWAGRTGVGDHVSGFELSGSEGPPGFGVLPDISWRESWAFWYYHRVFAGTGPRISQRKRQLNSCEQ